MFSYPTKLNSKPEVSWRFCLLAFHWWDCRWRHSRETQPASPRLCKTRLPSGRLYNRRQRLLPHLHSNIITKH